MKNIDLEKMRVYVVNDKKYYYDNKTRKIYKKLHGYIITVENENVIKEIRQRVRG